MNIEKKICIFTFITALVLLPSTYGRAATLVDPWNYSEEDYLNNNSQAANTESDSGATEDKPDVLKVSKVIPVSNSQSITKTEDTEPNIISTIGWKNENGAWYYYKSDNTKAIGWIKPDSNWYYLNEDNGKMVTGWLYDSNSWYYLDNSGVMSIGWKLINNKWYFFTSTGAMATGIQSDGSDLYYLKNSGEMAAYTGWKEINDKWYYFEKSAKIKTGWLNENNTYYYLQGDGSMVTGWIYLNGCWYYFNTGGDMATGWTTIDEKIYYLYDTGAMATGWITSNGSDYYYLDPTSGKMLTDTTIDGYKLGADGKRYEAINQIPLSTRSKTSDTNMKEIYNSVNSAAKKYDLDSKLILAIIKAESNFDPKVTSSSGATGLMQIMPANYAYLGITDGYDIEQNINGGSKLLKEYLDQFNGDIEIAVAAYNAGPQSIENEGVSSDDDLYKMSQGVQDYIKKVIKYYEDEINTQSGLNTI